jgi:hypothetical protein
MSRSNCKDCQAPIEWQEENGRWTPLDPRTQQRHRCQIDQTCETCEKTFKGANWMTTCPSCYRSGRSAQNRDQAEPEPAHEPEALRPGGYDDDVPPF